MYIPALELHRAATSEEALALLVQHSPAVRLLAGGTDVLTQLKTGDQGVRHLVDLGRIASMRGISVEPDGLQIGALTTINAIDRSPLVTGVYEILRDAAGQMATLQIRNTATVGGNISSANPCADMPPVLMALGAIAIVVSADGQREVPLHELLIGPGQTSLGRDELLLAINVPRPPAGSGAAYARFGLRNGNAISVAAVAAGVSLDEDGTVRAARLVLGAVAPKTKLVEQAGACLLGRQLDDAALDEAASIAMAAAEPITDLRASARYRRELVGVLTRRALSGAAQRARG